MRVLWLCNTLLPQVVKQLNLTNAKPESWIAGIHQQISGVSDMELIYLYPNPEPQEKVVIDNTTFIAYIQKMNTVYEEPQYRAFCKILSETTPDVIHIFGTESPHSLAMLRAAEKMGLLDKTVVSIQGLVSVIARHYLAGLDEKTVHAFSLRDFLKGDNIYRQAKAFARRGRYEEEALRLTRHVIGRTDWDKACVTRINPTVQYHFCNETLRKPFYQNTWDIHTCEKHSIFVSQCNYPIKGLHYMLEAMADIVKVYPDAHLYTTGVNPLQMSWKQKLRQVYYQKYLGKLIRRYGLEDRVSFLGYLDGEAMCERFCRSHVFVCCSSIENSPNSVGEAMLLGVPCVTSDMGGVKNMLTHSQEGFVYQADAPYMLGYYVKRIFEDDELALTFSENAKRHAAVTHDTEKNMAALISIYEKIAKCK